MSVFLLTWNPKLWNIADADWLDQVAKISSGRTFEEPWSIGSRTSGLHPGDTVLLVRVAKDLLSRLKELLVLNWRQKSAARSTLKLAIEDTLDTLPDSYDRVLYSQKCSLVFEHVYESYPEKNMGIYAAAS